MSGQLGSPIPRHSLVATTGTDGIIRLWRLDTGERLREMNVGASWLNCLAFTPDGERRVSGSEQTVTFWHPESGREVTSMTLERCVHNMAFNQDGSLLALAAESPRIRIWPAESQATRPAVSTLGPADTTHGKPAQAPTTD